MKLVISVTDCLFKALFNMIPSKSSLKVILLIIVWILRSNTDKNEQYPGVVASFFVVSVIC